MTNESNCKIDRDSGSERRQEGDSTQNLRIRFLIEHNDEWS
jgi:hypothetical protein